MVDECSPLNWDWSYQEEAHGLEELKHNLLYTTLELETTIACAQEEIARKGDEILHFKCLLTKTINERDEAQLKSQRLVLENLILQQKIQQLEANATSLARTTPSSYAEDDPNLGVDSSSGSDENFIECHRADRASQPPPPPQPEVIDNVVLRKGLPENGKFLQAVMEAGPLLQTLLLAGPLPQWQHPPPQLNSIEIPPVTIPSTSRVLLHQDSCVSAIIGGGNNDDGEGLMNRKRGLEQGFEGHNYDCAPTTKNQKVVHQSTLTNIK